MKLVTKILVGAISVFESIVIPRIKVEWFAKLLTLSASRLKAVAMALTDADLDNEAQLQQIAKETLLTPEFLSLQKEAFDRLAAQINEPVITQLFTGTEQLRTDLFLVLGDDVEANKEQVKQLLTAFVKTEDFDGLAIALVTLLADKYSTNDLLKAFIIGAVENLVNSDDKP